MKRLLILTIACAAIFSSCIMEKGVEGKKATEVEFSGNLTKTKTRISGLNGTEWSVNDPVGIYMMPASADLTAENAITSNSFYRTTANGTAGQFAPQGEALSYPTDGSEVKFIAYHPYSETIENFALSFSVADQSDLSAIDVLYAAPGNSKFSRTSTVPVPLKFSHKLTKLVFKVLNGDRVNEDVANGVTATISGVRTAGSLDLASGLVTSSGEAGELSAEGATTIEAIVLPSNNLSDVTVKFTNAANQSFVAKVPNAAWQSGYRYSYKVTLNRDESKLEIENEINPWDETGIDTDIEGNYTPES
jgi:hypothetical protein